MLHLPDFRAGERTFQLLVQAAGRAGRAEKKGRVMVQGMQADHPLILSALKQDYDGFAEREMSLRQDFAYPPFGRVVTFDFSSTKMQLLDPLCHKLQNWLHGIVAKAPEVLAGARILGPASPPIERVRGRYRRQLILAGTDVKAVRQLARTVAANLEQLLHGDLRCRIDVDPQSLL